MYAVIQTGGKQYRVSKGDKLRVELLEGEVGKKLAFEPLLVGGEGDAKVIHFRKKTEGWTKKRGHRQPYTEVVITSVRG